MRLSWTLSRYIGKQFLLSVLLTLLALVMIALLMDTIELIRRASNREFPVPFAAVAQMALLKSPAMAQKLLPFAVLIGSMLALMRLTRSQELVIARAAGVSVWQFLLPAVAVVGAVGLLTLSVFNPLSAVMLLKFEQVEGKYLTGKPSLLSVSNSGLWLRQIEENPESPVQEYIIYALRISQADLTFSNVILFSFDRQGDFTERLDAERARLTAGELVLEDGIRSLPGKPPEYVRSMRIPTTLNMSHIQDSFASPETMPFWSLPSFISTLEQAGFSALKHRLYWHSLLSSPLMLIGMVLAAAVFSLRMPRRGRLGALIIAGIITGFLFYFFTDVVQALGAAGTLPVVVAAWTPALILLVGAAATLLHLEDG